MTKMTQETTASPEPAGQKEVAAEHTGVVVTRPSTVRECLADDTGATTAEYAITTLAACGFAALLVVVLKSDPLKDMIMGVITGALGLGA